MDAIIKQEESDMLKRILAFCLSFVLLLSMLPAQTLASEIPEEEISVTEETAVETEAQENFPEESAPETQTQETGETVVEETTAEETMGSPEEETTVTLAEEPFLAAAGVKDETYLQQVYEEPYAYVEQDVVMRNDYTWGDEYRFKMKSGTTLTVTRGTTLTLNGSADIQGTILVESGAALVLNSRFNLFSGGTLRVEQGATLDLRGGSYTISCTESGILDVRGTITVEKDPNESYPWVDIQYYNGMWSTVSGVPASYMRAVCMVDTESELRGVVAMQEGTAYNSFLVSVGKDITLTEDLNIRDNTLSNSCVIKVDGDAVFTIPKGVTLTNGDTFSVNDGTICNEGKIISEGWISVNDTFENKGTLELGNGLISVAKNGVFHNNGQVLVGSNARVDISGIWNGPEPVPMVRNEHYLEQLMHSDDMRPVLGADVVLNNDFTLSGDVHVLNINATITVPAGKTLTIDGNFTTFINGSGAIRVEKGGTLIIRGVVAIWGNGGIENRGTMKAGNDAGHVIINYENGAITSNSVGIPKDIQWLRFIINNDQDLQDAVQQMKKTDYVYYILLVHGDIDLSADVTIPADARLTLSDMPSTMTIPAGRKLINNGELYVNGDQAICNYGTIENNNCCSIDGRMNNQGTFRNNGWLYVNGRWEGYPAQQAPASQAEVEKAMKENGGYYLNRELILERDLTVKGWLEVGTGGRLVVPKGKKLTVAADSSLIVAPYGTLEVYGSYELKKNADAWKSTIALNTENDQLGTVIGVAESDLRYCGYVYDAANFTKVAQMVNAHPDADHTFIYVQTNVELTEDLLLPENCILHLNNGTVTIPEGCTLTNRGEFYCWEGQRVVNRGTIDNQNFFLVHGTLENGGQMNLQSGSLLVLDVPGYANNTGSVDAYALDAFEHYGTWEGNSVQYHCISQEEFQQQLSQAAASGGKLTLDKALTLTKDLVIPETVELTISGAQLTVPKDVKLTLKGGVILHEGGIAVDKGGELDLMGMIFMHYNGVLQVEGTFRSNTGDGDNVALFYANGMTPCTVTGVPREKQRLYVQLWEQEQYWLGGLEAFEANGYSKVFLEILSDVTLPRDLTIPENGYLLIEGYAQKLTVPEGVTLTNYGVLRIDEAKSIFNYGTIENRGYFYVRANLHNFGQLKLMAGGTMELPKWGYVNNGGEATVSGGSRLTMAEDSMWVGNEPIWQFITQDQLEAEIAGAVERGETYTLNADVTLERDLTLSSRLIVGSGGNLLVPKGRKLTLRAELDVVAGGRLEIQGSYAFEQGGRVATRYENGRMDSQILGVANADLLVRMPVLSQEDLLRSAAALEAEGYGTGVLQLFESVTLTRDLTVPRNALVHLESDSDLTVSPGCTLTNLGHIYVWDGNTLENNGTIYDHNQLVIEGSFVNNGTLEVAPREKNMQAVFYVGEGGSVWSMGRIALGKNGFLDMHGTWNGIWPPELNGGMVLPQAQSLTIEGDKNILVDLRQNQGFTLKVCTPGAVLQQLNWSTDDCNGQVLDLCGIRDMGNGEYYLPLVGAGKATLTVSTMDGSNLSATVTVEAEWADWSPRLGSSTIQVNPLLEAGGRVSLVPSFGNQILSCRIGDNRFTAEYDEENAVLLVNTAEEMKNTTVATRLFVTCADGETYDYNLKLAVKNAVPGITVKQVGKVDLFYTDSQAELNVTAKDAAVTALELTDTEDFCLEDGKLRLTDSFIRDCRNYPKLKPDTKATLLVYLEGCRFPVTKAINIGTTTGKMNLTAVPATETVHSALGGDLTARFQVMNKSTKTLLELQADHIYAVEAAFLETWQVEEGGLALTLSGSTGGTAAVWVRLDNWMQAVKVSCKITVNDKLPTVKAAASTLKLSSTFPGQTAETALMLSHGNLEIAHFENNNLFLSTAKAGTSARAEADKLQVFYDGINIVAKIKDANQIPKAGTYSFSAVPVVAGTELKPVTVKVNVAATLPKVKLSAGTVKLNTLLSGEEVATVKVTMTNTTGYDLRLVGFQILEPFFEYVDVVLDGDILSLRLLNRRIAKYPHTLIPILEDDRGTQVKLPAVKLTVQSYEKEVSVTQSAKGSLDAIARENGMVYTISKLTNALGTVESVELAKGGEWFTLGDLGTDAKGKQTFTLKLREDVPVSVKEAYEVQLRYRICGMDVLSKPMKLKVKESKLKAVAPGVTYYQSQQAPLKVPVTVTAPLGAEIESISVNAKTAAQLRNAIGELSLEQGNLFLQITTPGDLTPGKTYKLVLDVTPKGHAQDAKLPQITVNVKIAK